MPQWIATSWDKNQLLILAARTKKGKAFYEKAVRILPDLPADQPDAVPEFTPETVKAKLRHFVQQERLGKYDTVVVLGRDDVEVRSMLFPPVPNDELPDMAKFQASKEFTEYDQFASLDFVLFDGARKDKKHILAASLTKSKRETVEDVITGAGLDLQRIVLGPCESAKRFATITVQQKTGGAGKTTLLVEMSELSATLVLLYRGQSAFVRTAHFQKSVWAELDQADKKLFENADELAQWKWLTSEFKRTVVAAINDVPSEKIDEMVLCGVGERYEKLMVLLEESMAVPVSLFNVWRFENREGEIRHRLPLFEEQFLPLIGALTSALTEKPNALDFRNPKRKPEKHVNRNMITAIVAACVLLVITTVGWGFYRRTVIEDELNLLQRQQNELKEATLRHDQLKLQNDSINTWKKGEVNWLEQLEWLSSNMLRSQDVIVSGNLTLNSPVNTDPFLKFTANTRGTAIIPQLEAALRDATHNVISPKASETRAQPYTHTAEITVKIVPPPKQTTQPTTQTSPAVSTPVPAPEEAVEPATPEQTTVSNTPSDRVAPSNARPNNTTPGNATSNNARPGGPPGAANEGGQQPRNRNAARPSDVVPPNEAGATNAPARPTPPGAPVTSVPSPPPAVPVTPVPSNPSAPPVTPAVPETTGEPGVSGPLDMTEEPTLVVVIVPNATDEFHEPDKPAEPDTGGEPVVPDVPNTTDELDPPNESGESAELDESEEAPVAPPDAEAAGPPLPDITDDSAIDDDEPEDADESDTNGGTP
ncbi:MAG: hypothetical protein FWH27_01720 [Planctomycetaceae bacterium]|nr:hypothetical protein [Planctomycetaceae bacterium]